MADLGAELSFSSGKVGDYWHLIAGGAVFQRHDNRKQASFERENEYSTVRTQGSDGAILEIQYSTGTEGTVRYCYAKNSDWAVVGAAGPECLLSRFS